MRIGLISDTHLPSLVRSLDELGTEIADILGTCELILHGGDVQAPSVLDWLERFAPVLVAEGNNDLFHDPRMKPYHLFEVAGWRIGLAHELRPESRPISHILLTALEGNEVDILIGGDTHVERLEYREGVLFINSASPILPHHLSTRLGSLGVLELSHGRARAEIIALGPSEGLRNPIVPQHVVIEHGEIVEASYAGYPISPELFLEGMDARARHHERLLAEAALAAGE